MKNTPMFVLESAFRDYRAEWQREQFGRFFIEPPYLGRMAARRPCFLEGGRGTGKTVALKSLGFREVSRRNPGADRRELPHYGVYVRANQNRVRAFDSPAFSLEESAALFAHYLNLILVGELAALGEWLCSAGAPAPTESNLHDVAMCFGFSSEDIQALRADVTGAIIQLQVYINNPHAIQRPILSPAELPVTLLAQHVSNQTNQNAPVFVCLDEFENLSERQQRVVNAYVKHAQHPLSYKIGVKKLGRWTRRTLGDELLESPADFDEIDVSSYDEFASFAKRVVEARLDFAREQGVDLPESVRELLPELPLEQEARLLGAERTASLFHDKLAATSADLASAYAKLALLDRHILAYWHARSNEAPASLIGDFEAHPGRWSDRQKNYGYESLFWLSRGRRGAGLKKYYTGWDTFFLLASGNIRYLLELLDRSITLAAQNPPDEGTPLAVQPQVQTEAARAVARGRIDQLDSLTDRGADLKRMVLAVGKVFFELARNPLEGMPEVNSFVLSGSVEAQRSVTEILTLGVSHLAFEVSPRTKATSTEEMRDGEYRLHPIFCPFFEFSYRKKRRITFAASDLLQLGSQPKLAIANMLDGRASSDEQLPEQLSLYAAFFNGERGEES